MNFKKMMKRGQEGFTLVELIVVIAILGILAGIGIPAYSGYVTKAQRASEEQTVAALHSMFVIACVSEGEDHTEVTSLTAEWNDKTVTGLASVGHAAAEAIIEEFEALMAGGTYTFEVLTQDEVNTGIRLGIGNNDTYKIAYGNGYITITASQLEALKNSTFGEMGMGPLLEQLDTVTAIAAGMTSHDAVKNVLDSDGFCNSAAAAMGLDPSKYESKSALQAAIYAEQQKLAAERAKINGTTPEAEMDAIAANAAVLYVAQQTSQMDTTKMNELMSTASKQSILEKMTSSDSTVAGEGMAQAALMCGMYTAYVNSDEYKGDEAGKEVNVLNVLNALENDDFKTFCEGTQGQADLSGYMNSLGMISSSSNDKDATSQLLVNGFNDPALEELLNSKLN